MRLTRWRHYCSRLISLVLLLVVFMGCRSKEPVASVHVIADKYGPLTGKLARLAASGEAARIVEAGKAEKRQYTLGASRKEVRVT